MSEEQVFSPKAKIVQNYFFFHLLESTARRGVLETGSCEAKCILGTAHSYSSCTPSLIWGEDVSEGSSVSAHIKIFKMKPQHVFPGQHLSTWSSARVLRRRETLLINKGPKQEASP